MFMWSDSKTQVNTSAVYEYGVAPFPIGGNIYIAVAATLHLKKRHMDQLFGKSWSEHDRA